ncbi:MAG TPA: CheR family methyltransferase [Edaphocola sp.]|nr:CheR family methyltransferase [Edaphocola sp.]
MAAQKKHKIQAQTSLQKFPIVGIGASAGGLEAFTRFIKIIPEVSGMAYVLIQHFDPSHESFLVEILQRISKIPVCEITEATQLAPDHIYIIPSNKILRATDEGFQLSPRVKNSINLCIDVFFTALAEVHKEFAIGVVLSGTGNDGTIGLKNIKDHGGISFVQDKISAEYYNMPQSAINAGVVDFVLTPEEILEQLLKINKVFQTIPVFKFTDEVSKEKEEIPNQIIGSLHQLRGVDFSFYKPSIFQRGIARRIAMRNKNNLDDYFKFLHNNVEEQDALFQDVLIPVTSFFRDPKTFENLSNIIFPTLFKDKPLGESFRVWIAGCSTGEEPFSMAICLHEFLGEKFKETKIQIFASDISEKAIRKARAGIYNSVDLAHLSDNQIKKYFVRSNSHYEISKLIREMCIFAQHNFLKDPPFAKMDLVSCRNVLIYMVPLLQKEALSTFHYALKEKGFLLLGKSETIDNSSKLFSQFVKNDKIYLRKPSLKRSSQFVEVQKKESLTAKIKTTTKQEALHSDFRKSAEAIMISNAPPSVVVDEDMDVVHIYGEIAPFLQQPQGKPTHNLLKMARKGLAFEMRSAIHKAKSSKNFVIKEDISFQSKEEHYLITLTIIPLKHTDNPYFLIQFEKKISLEEKQGNNLSSKIESTLQIRNQKLEEELLQTRKDMRSITEEMEAANEELQNANEELQSSNEEMQSLNEELETSKEELQSTNQELIIINQELIEKQQQLSASRHYAESIVSTLREPLIVLDNKLRVKTANASFYKEFNAEEHEIEGRLFYEIQNRLWDNPVMKSLFEKFLPGKERLTDFEITLQFPLLGKRTMLMNARQIANKKTSEQLILLAIEDVTERKENEQKLKTFTERLENKVKERTAELKVTIEELKQSNQQLDQFANAASHDMQEPLRKVLTFINRLKKEHHDELSADSKTYINKIENASGRMQKLISDLLNYSRLLQHEKLFIPTNLNEIMKDVLSDFELLIEEKNATIKIADLPTIDAIPLQMNQLFLNIISNALKFSKENVSLIVTIKSRMLSEKEVEKFPKLNPHISCVEMIFKDNGIGFEQKYASKIFSIFQRLHDKETYNGTGIGLALCKRIVENHHGEIFAIARENKGASFHIILPIKQINHY